MTVWKFTRTAILAAALLITIHVPAASAVDVSVSGERLSIDGQEQFVVFVSYFGALRHDAATQMSVLQSLKNSGVRGVRIFPNWWANFNCGFGTTLMTANGWNLFEYQKLASFVDLADSYGLVVDVSFAMETVPGLTFASYKDQMRNILYNLSMKGVATYRKNIIVDLQNEYNYPFNAPGCSKVALTVPQIKELRDAVYYTFDGGMKIPVITASEEQSVSGGQAGRDANAASLDLATWHEYRNPAQACVNNQLPSSLWWVRCTCQRVAEVRSASAKPIYLQEPSQSNLVPAESPSAPATVGHNYLIEAAARAKAAGAAAWTLHTEGGFALIGADGRPAPPVLTWVESDFLARFAAELAGITWGGGCGSY